MRRAVVLNNIQRSWPWWRWVLTGLNILALVLSAILSWHYLLGGSMAGCGGGSPCEQVLNSRWSVLAGIFPVSGLAVGVYLALLVSILFIGPATDMPARRLVWKVMLILSGAIAGSAIWFTIVQKWIIGAFCPYCMTTHITGLLLAAPDHMAGDNGKWYSNSEVIIRPLPAMGLVLTGLAHGRHPGASQVGLSLHLPIYHDDGSQENLPSIDYHTAPMVGSPDAPYVVTLLFDYQCSHCQKIHFMLGEAVRRYDGKLAFALCPAPLNAECNPFVPQNTDLFKNSCELARISLAVWIAGREVFPEFENWMFTFESGDSWQPRSPESARVKAVELVGQVAFDAAWIDPRVEKYLQTCIRIFGQTLQRGRGGIPKMIFGSHWVIPEPANADDLIGILQKSLGVPLP